MSKKKNLSRMLSENSKKITVMYKGEEKTLAEMTEMSANAVVSVASDGIIPVTAAEAAENSIAGENKTTVISSYADGVFSAYEYCLKNNEKQTLFVTAPVGDIERIFGFDEPYPQIEMLRKRSNIDLIIDEIPTKYKKRLEKWAEDDEVATGIYIVKIPDILIFYDNIKKGEVSTTKCLDLIIQLVKTDKSLKKLKKKGGEKFQAISEEIIINSFNVIKELGVSSVHIDINEALFMDVQDYCTKWITLISAENSKLINRIVFCTVDPVVLVEAQSALRKAGAAQNVQVI